MCVITAISGISKRETTPLNIDVTYWEVAHVNIDRRAKGIELQIYGYSSSSNTNGEPLKRKSVIFKDKAYDALSNNIDAFLKAAIIKVENLPDWKDIP